MGPLMSTVLSKNSSFQDISNWGTKDNTGCLVLYIYILAIIILPESAASKLAHSIVSSVVVPA